MRESSLLKKLKLIQTAIRKNSKASTLNDSFFTSESDLFEPLSEFDRKYYCDEKEKNRN